MAAEVKLQTLIHYRREQWQQLQQLCCQRIARCLLDSARLRIAIPAPASQPETTSAPAIELLQNQIRKFEQDCLKDVLALMQFSSDEIVLSELPVTNGEWQLDLFSPQTLKTLGLDTASAAATGAAIGVGVDLLFAGISLGAATATGAALGAAWHNSRRFGKDLWQKLRGQTFIVVDDLTLDALLLRQLWLAQTLFQRGHAATQRAQLNDQPKLILPADWPRQCQHLRRIPEDRPPHHNKAEDQLREWLQNLIN